MRTSPLLCVCAAACVFTVQGSAQTAGINFGQLPIGGSTTAAVTVSIPSAATLGAIAVVTQGAAGLDFVNAGGGSCVAESAWAANSSCTVNVTFAPHYPGMRYGAVVLTDTNGERISVAYVYGSGQGPQAGFLPGIPSPVMYNSQTFPEHVAVDGNGNVFLIDSLNNSNTVVKETPGASGYTQSEFGSGLVSPNGIAVDGAGDVYIADTYEFRIVKESLSGGNYVQTILLSIAAASYPSEPYGIAVDGSGNLYITDVSNKRLLKETLSAGGYTQSIIPTNGLNAAYGIAVDGNGNVYVADTFNNRVVEETLSGGTYTQSTVATGLSDPYGVAVDGNGNVYIADTLNSRVLRLTPSGENAEPSTVGDGLVYPYGVAVDVTGNIYIADSGNHRAVKENFAVAPSLSFAATKEGCTSSDSPQAVTLTNLGNVPLQFASVSFPGDFPQSPSANSDCTSNTSLAAGATCTLTIDFSPVATVSSTAGTPLNENVAVTTNSLDAAQSVLDVAVTGTEEPPSQSAATPTFSVNAGTYPTALSITLKDATNGAVIYYTINGSMPTPNSTKYAAPIAVSQSTTINAIAVASGYANSAVASATYTIAPPAATPVFSLNAGSYLGTQTLAISDATSGAAIYYTTNGATPTSGSSRYSGPLAISQTTTINAIAVASGHTNSAVASATFAITVPTPVFSPGTGTYKTAQTVAITDANSGAAIYYTTNGATPTTASTRYTGPVKVSGSETIRAIAVVAGCTNSTVASAVYTITPPPAAATPAFSIKAGTYNTAQKVSITDATSNATIYYTTNGTTPTTGSTRYSGPINVTSSETIEAVAVADGYSNSAVASAAYVIK